MDSPCIKQTVCKVLKIFQYGKYLVAYVLKEKVQTLMVSAVVSSKALILLLFVEALIGCVVFVLGS